MIGSSSLPALLGADVAAPSSFQLLTFTILVLTTHSLVYTLLTLTLIASLTDVRYSFEVLPLYVFSHLLKLTVHWQSENKTP